jgi:hypothetical protein
MGTLTPTVCLSWNLWNVGLEAAGLFPFLMRVYRSVPPGSPFFTSIFGVSIGIHREVNSTR